VIMESDNVRLEKDNLQYNSQDMVQEQNMKLNPTQNNAHNVFVVVANEKADYSGKISGITYLGKSRIITKDVDILLFFGQESTVPVYRTKSDANGNFNIGDIPPGFYTICAKYGEYQTRTQYIKVLPGQNVYQAILL
jgi:hypothetical protein